MQDITWTDELVFAGRMLLAFGLALPIAWERELSDRIMGLRTFPLVAMATCAFTLLGRSFISPDADDALARILQGLITGIGFIGGGAILRRDSRTLGTATAASIWLTGAMGVAIALDKFIIAIVLSLCNFGVLRFLVRFKQPDANGDLDGERDSE